MALAQAELRFVHGKDENALPAAERALELNAALPEAHCIKARYLEEEGRADEAEQQMRTALQARSRIRGRSTAKPRECCSGAAMRAKPFRSSARPRR